MSTATPRTSADHPRRLGRNGGNLLTRRCRAVNITSFGEAALLLCVLDASLGKRHAVIGTAGFVELATVIHPATFTADDVVAVVRRHTLPATHTPNRGAFATGHAETLAPP